MRFLTAPVCVLVASALGGIGVGFLADNLLVSPVGKLLLWPISVLSSPSEEAAPAEKAEDAASEADKKEQAPSFADISRTELNVQAITVLQCG